jgi:hypothetical protein
MSRHVSWPTSSVFPPRRDTARSGVVQVDNNVSLDFADDHGPVRPQHYAFLVGEEEFDQILARIVERGLTYWADPFHRQPNRINTNDGGRGLYWDDPDGHGLEIITRPYGG